jgi:hypothetical protein
MRLATLVTGLTLAAVLIAVPPASAADTSDLLPLPVAGDTDGDGWVEVDWEFSTPQCGCACPVVGAGFDLVGAGQEESSAWFATSGCQTAWDVDFDGGEPDATDPARLEPFLICWGATTVLCGSIAFG